MLIFRREAISAEAFEAAGVWDVDGDGHLDIVSGSFWYKGPGFQERFFICDSSRHGEYYDDFSVLPMDLNGDGKKGFVSGGWWGDCLRHRFFADDPHGPWTEERLHAGLGNIETTRMWDVDGDGVLEIVPNTPGSPFCYYKAAGGRLEKKLIRAEPIGHGYGFGDIDGDGQGEFVFGGGIIKRRGDAWETIPAFKLDHWDASCPMLVGDVNGDGRADLIVGHAHSRGLYWLEQAGGGAWRKHWIDPEGAQYHDLHWADVDGDGKPELVTGKRHRAHNGKEAGEGDPLSISVFKWNGESFSRQVVDHVWPGQAGGGCGIQFALADLRGSGRLDIIAPGKDGLFVYWNLGHSSP